LAVVLTVAAVIVIVASTALTGIRNDAQAQFPPQPEAVIFDGSVTVNGSPIGMKGLSLTAKVGDWVSESVTIGKGTPDDLNGYEGLTVRPPGELLGSEIKFLLGGTIESTTASYYAKIDSDGKVLINEPIGLLDIRKLDIDFPALPDAMPSDSDSQPRKQPATGQPVLTIFSGQVFTPDGLAPDGYKVFAVVGGTLRSENGTVIEGEYRLAVNTTDSSYDGSAIRFYLIDKGDPMNPNKTLEAETPSIFKAGYSAEVRLFFSKLAPTPTPEPTATPIPPTHTPTPVPPTATPEPPTPTATLIPPTATPTSTATPVPPTSTPEPTSTPVPPSATPIPPTATSVPPTSTPEPTSTPVPPSATPIPPTATSVPPTSTPEPTSTPVPPSATPIPPTATSVPPTSTPEPPTVTPVPPTATPVPPTATPEPEESSEFNATVPLAIVLILILLAIAGYFGWQYSRRSRNESEEA
jgi:hypothetical protein